MGRGARSQFQRKLRAIRRENRRIGHTSGKQDRIAVFRTEMGRSALTMNDLQGEARQPHRDAHDRQTQPSSGRHGKNKAESDCGQRSRDGEIGERKKEKMRDQNSDRQR